MSCGQFWHGDLGYWTETETEAKSQHWLDWHGPSVTMVAWEALDWPSERLGWTAPIVQYRETEQETDSGEGKTAGRAHGKSSNPTAGYRWLGSIPMTYGQASDREILSRRPHGEQRQRQQQQNHDCCRYRLPRASHLPQILRSTQKPLRRCRKTPWVTFWCRKAPPATFFLSATATSTGLDDLRLSQSPSWVSMAIPHRPRRILDTRATAAEQPCGVLTYSTTKTTLCLPFQRRFVDEP